MNDPRIAPRGTPLQTAWAYLRLYRLDVVLLSFFSVLVGAQMAGAFDPSDALLALFVAFAPMNFVYSFNAWSDWRIDAINKPGRPIPSGQVSPRGALVYAGVLAALSVGLPLAFQLGGLVYPAGAYRPPVALALLLAIPGLGWAYSGRPARLKRFPPAATLVTSLILVLPMTIGYALSRPAAATPPPWQTDALFFAGLLLFCLAVIPLKDIEDEEGDVAEECGNWAARLGSGRLLLLSAAGLTLDLLLYALLPLRPLQQIFLFAFAGAALALVLLFRLAPLPRHRLYKTIIRAVILLGVLLFALTRLGVIAPGAGA